MQGEEIFQTLPEGDCRKKAKNYDIDPKISMKIFFHYLSTFSFIQFYDPKSFLNNCSHQNDSF